MRTIVKITNLVTVFLIAGVITSFVNFGLLSVFFSVIMPIIFTLYCVLALYNVFRKKYIYLIGIPLFFIFYNFFFQFNFKSKTDSANSVSILTYNVGGVKKNVSSTNDVTPSKEIIKFVDSINSDILVIQEAPRSVWKKIKSYPYMFVSYRQNIDKSIQTIYSKHPIISKGYIDFPDTSNNAIYADIKINDDTLRIYNVHLQSFIINRNVFNKKFYEVDYLKQLNHTTDRQIKQARMIKSHANSSKLKVVICGDFNATQYSKPYRILKKALKDSFIENGNGFGNTFSLYTIPLRLDYFLSDPQFEIVRHKNFEIKLSDHEPVLINYKID